MDGIELMATAMHAAQARLDVSAANLANVSSAGFHKHVAHAVLTSRGLVTTSRVDDGQGPLTHTGRAFDLAVIGRGGFVVRAPGGAMEESRGGSFQRNARGELIDGQSRALWGARGPLVVSADATIDERGVTREADRPVARIHLSAGASLQSGFLEGANVDAVHEMVDVLSAQRAFETAQKTLVAIDDARQKDVNDVARVK